MYLITCPSQQGYPAQHSNHYNEVMCRNELPWHPGFLSFPSSFWVVI